MKTFCLVDGFTFPILFVGNWGLEYPGQNLNMAYGGETANLRLLVVVRLIQFLD